MGDVIMMLQVPSTVDDVIKMFVTGPWFSERCYKDVFDKWVVKWVM